MTEATSGSAARGRDGADLAAAAATVGAVVLAYLIVGRIGDYPIDDSFSYSATAMRFYQTGRFVPDDWTGIPLLGAVLWSWPFQAVFGGSERALRISVLAIGLAVPLAAYFSARLIGATRALAAAGALLLALEPLAFSRAFSFMTDIPFAGFAALAMWAHLRWIARGGRADFAASVLLAVAATLTRQLGLFLPLAFAVSIALSGGPMLRRAMLALLPLAACVAAARALSLYLESIHALPSLFNDRWQQLGQIAAQFLDIRAPVYFGQLCLFYLGLLLLPLTVLVSPKARGASRFARIAAAGLPLLGLALFAYQRMHQGNLIMPYLKDTVVPQGIGPVEVWNEYGPGPHLGDLPDGLWIAVTVMGACGYFLLVRLLAIAALASISRVMSVWRSDGFGGLLLLARERRIELTLATAVAAYMVPLVYSSPYDRYLVGILPAAVLLLFRLDQGLGDGAAWRWAASALLIAAFAFFSIAGTRDRIAWNERRWQLGEGLLREGVSPREIDGGFAFNGRYNYMHVRKRDPGSSGWWVWDDRYTITLGPRPGYCERTRREYRRALTGTQAVLLLRRIEPGIAADGGRCGPPPANGG